MGATLIAISPELPDESLTISERNVLEFEVFTDKGSSYAREVGIVFTIDEKLRPSYAGFGIDLEKYNGKGQFDVSLAATFVVNVDGIIVYALVNADYTIRAEPKVVVDVLKPLFKK
tara:strand:+ start:1724 stop:2071 length:348 start_codon:yes stop_codon:yes gene_type:complete